MEMPMYDKAMKNAEECEKRGDSAGMDKWLKLAELAEKFYANKNRN